MPSTLDSSDFLDENGYPTDEAETTITNWPHEDWRGLMAFVKSLWRYSEMWNEKPSTDLSGKPVTEYEVSTGGWSGNESLIYAMKQNRMFWMFCWVQSRRGGHYIFEVRA